MEKIKDWNDMSNEEKQESFNRYTRIKIIEAINSDSAFWKQDRNMEEIQKSRPYNAQTGINYSGINSIILESTQIKNKFKSPQWVTMSQANYMGAKIPEYTKGVKILYLKNQETIPVINSKGEREKEYLLNKDGSPKIIQSGIHQGKRAYKFKYEIKKLEKPILETTIVFNVEQIPELNKNKIKERITQPRSLSIDLSSLKLLPDTQKQIENYIIAQNSISNYISNTKQKKQEKNKSR